MVGIACLFKIFFLVCPTRRFPFSFIHVSGIFVSTTLEIYILYRYCTRTRERLGKGLEPGVRSMFGSEECGTVLLR